VAAGRAGRRGTYGRVLVQAPRDEPTAILADVDGTLTSGGQL
jgi:hypothetical protein